MTKTIVRTGILACTIALAAGVSSQQVSANGDAFDSSGVWSGMTVLPPHIVEVNYEGLIINSSGTPFGLTVPLPMLGVTEPPPAAIAGSFVFDTATPDDNADATQGDYVHTAGGGFSADFLGVNVTGSETPVYGFTADIGGPADTISIADGPTAGGNMSVNGTIDATVMLTALFADDMIEADTFVNPFELFDLSSGGTTVQTIRLEDGGGFIEFELTSVETLVDDVICGDFDNNGVVAASDVLRLLNRAVGNPVELFCPAATPAASCGDVDDNGKVSAGDALRVLKAATDQSVQLICATAAS